MLTLDMLYPSCETNATRAIGTSSVRERMKPIVGTTVGRLCYLLANATGSTFSRIHTNVIKEAEHISWRMKCSLASGNACELVRHSATILPMRHSANGKHRQKLNHVIGAAAAIAISFASLLLNNDSRLRRGDLTEMAANAYELLDSHGDSVYGINRTSLTVETQTIERGLYGAKQAMQETRACKTQEYDACRAEYYGFVNAAWPTTDVKLDLEPCISRNSLMIAVATHSLQTAIDTEEVHGPRGVHNPSSHLKALEIAEHMNPRQLQKLALTSRLHEPSMQLPQRPSLTLSLAQLPNIINQRRDNDHSSVSYDSNSSYGSCDSYNSCNSYSSQSSQSSHTKYSSYHHNGAAYDCDFAAVGDEREAFARMRLEARVAEAALLEDAHGIDT